MYKPAATVVCRRHRDVQDLSTPTALSILRMKCRCWGVCVCVLALAVFTVTSEVMHDAAGNCCLKVALLQLLPPYPSC
eukprot:20484-Heterococcus_DN1.PRE.1